MKHTLKIIVLSTAGFISLTGYAAENDQPNVIFIMADDLGWSDLACYGSRYYATPNIDKLAEEGMRFTSAYMMPTCAPSRASLMTGMYPPKTGIYTVDAYAKTPREMQKIAGIPSKKDLKPDDVTIADALKEAGYTTGHFGKWHLGDEPETYPEGQGFDVNLAGCESGRPDSYFSPFGNIKNIPEQEKGTYLTDVLTDGALDFISENKEHPFFLYLSFYQVHVPIHAKKEWMSEYRQAAGVNGQDVPAYGAVVSYTDHCVGRILDQLERLGLAENTVVIFTSDNGGQIAVTSNSPLRGQKGNLYEGGIRVPLIVKWPGRTTPASGSDFPVTVVDHFPTLLDVAGVEHYPGNGQLDGVSIVPLLEGATSLDREAIFWHLPAYNGNGRSNSLLWQAPGGAVRTRDWKLIENFEDGALELYNLKEDISENVNLVREYPAKAQKLLTILKDWQKQIHAPVPDQTNQAFEPGSRDWTATANQRDDRETNRLIMIK